MKMNEWTSISVALVRCYHAFSYFLGHFIS